VPVAPVEVPSGLLAALGAGPVGGVGSGTVGDPAPAPRLALGVPDGVATRESARLGSEGGGRLSDVLPAAAEALPDPQGAVIGAALPVAALTTAGHQALIRAAVASVVRVISFPPRWLGAVLGEVGVPLAGEVGPGTLEPVLPVGDGRGADIVKDEGVARATTVPGIGLQPDAPGAVGLAVLAAAASALVGYRLGRGGSSLPQSGGGLSEGEGEDSSEPIKPTARI
jgi:hypothetical protein